MHAEDVDMSLGQQNPQHWLSGEQNLQLQTYLEEDAGVHVHWHSWVRHDARAQACMRQTHVHSVSCSIDPGDPSLEVQRDQVGLMCKMKLTCAFPVCFFALKDVHNVQADDIHKSLGQQNPPILVLGETEPSIEAELGSGRHVLPPVVRVSCCTRALVEGVRCARPDMRA